MKVLLDENFPLSLLSALRDGGLDADHVITLGWRGVPDRVLRERVTGQHVLFVTQDTEFLTAAIEPFCDRTRLTRLPVTADWRARLDLGTGRP